MKNKVGVYSNIYLGICVVCKMKKVSPQTDDYTIYIHASGPTQYGQNEINRKLKTRL